MAEITVFGKFTRLDLSASDGSEKACAVLYRAVDASASDQLSTLNTNDTLYQESMLTWPVGITEEQTLQAIKDLREHAQKVR